MFNFIKQFNTNYYRNIIFECTNAPIIILIFFPNVSYKDSVSLEKWISSLLYIIWPYLGIEK